LRVVYFGKLQLCPRVSDGIKKDINTTRLEDMISEIWRVSTICNKKHGVCVSGHLVYTKEHHVCQLIEGKADSIVTLMENIRKDPRVIVYSEFRKRLQTMNLGWNVSMCYAFQITTEQYKLIADDEITPEQMFNSMKNSYEVRREGWKLSEFYKTTVDTFLLKYISIEDNVKFRRVGA